MAVAALLQLKNQRALALERGAVTQKFGGDRHAAPCIHHGAPRRVAGKTCKCSQRDRDQQDGKNGDRTALPTFLAFPEKKRQKHQSKKHEYRADEEDRRFERRWQKREDRVQPQEKEIRARSGLNNGGIGRTRGTERAEIEGAGHDRENDEGAEEKILVNRAGNEWQAIFLGQCVVVLYICSLADYAARHRPLVDSEADDHQKMNRDEGDE